MREPTDNLISRKDFLDIEYWPGNKESGFPKLCCSWADFMTGFPTGQPRTVASGNHRRNHLMKIAWVFCLWLLGVTLSIAETRPLHKLSKADLEMRLAGDARSVLVERQGLQSVISYMD